MIFIFRTLVNNRHFSQLLFLLCCLSLSTTGCAGGTNLQQEYGDDACYFIGLNSLASGDKDNASRLLKESINKSSPLVARRAAEKYAELGDVQERIQRYEELYKRFPDKDSLLRTCRELNNDEEYAKIMNLTEGIDCLTEDNELVYYHLNALFEKKIERFAPEFSQWCLTRPFTSEQYKLYTKVVDAPIEIRFRASVYRQEYGIAYENIRTVCANANDNLSPFIISDAGKASLYGSSDYLQNAYFFDNLARKLSGESKFFAYFYAGRLYERADNSDSVAVSRFKKAMETTTADNSYDNALWYYLNTQLKISTSAAISAVESYRKSWHDASYYDDFFDTLSVRLLSQHLWTDFYQTAKLLDGYASDEIVAKYSYITARLIESGFVSSPNASAIETETALYTRALSSGSDLYYRLLAAKKLSIPDDKFDTILYRTNSPASFTKNDAEEKLLSGYADFGLGEYIYPEWQQFSSQISVACVKKIASFLQQGGSSGNDFYEKSLRIAAKKINNCEILPDEDLLKLVYPQNFHDAASNACQRFKTPEYLLYALIRSESFFDPQVVSHAGASGLTQLMGSTAGDIAHKLQMEKYDLNDSTTNILFGCFYLEEMRRRLDGSSILAVFAYNGGISRVRTWVKSANLEFGTNTLPKDLFLEALPFAETREYGRKVVSAAAMYGYLYYGKTTSQVIEEILQ